MGQVERYEEKMNRRKAQLEKVLGDTLTKLDNHRSGHSVLSDEVRLCLNVVTKFDFLIDFT